MTVATAASALRQFDVFVYGGVEVEVKAVTALDARLVEVNVRDAFANNGERFLDYGVNEIIQVVTGPSTEADEPVVAPVKAPVAPVVSATSLALQAVRGGKVKSLPASASLVLFALAAVQDSGVEFPSVDQVARAAGLAPSTTAGHLRSLRGKGAVREAGAGRWAAL